MTDTLIQAIRDKSLPSREWLPSTRTIPIDEVIALINAQSSEMLDNRAENTLIASQEMNILEWLKKEHSEVFKEQKHLDEGSAERVYWHYGRWATLRDLRKKGVILPKREMVNHEKLVDTCKD